MEKLALCGYYDEQLHITQFANEVKIIPEVKSIHLFTIDFTLIAKNLSREKTLVDRVKYPNSVIKDDELFKFIRKLYLKVTTNKNGNILDQNIGFKYIRFYRITRDEFIVTDNFDNTIDYKSLLKLASEQYIFLIYELFLA